MSSFRRILVGIKDPSRGATPALRKAVQLARATGARLELFHAITTPIYLDAYGTVRGMVAKTQRNGTSRQTERLQALVRSATGHGRRRPLRVSVNASWDSPAYDAIVRRAHDWKADLVVVDRHGGSNLLASWMHFADWELVRQCAVPVLLVRSGTSYLRPTVLAGIDPSHQRSKPASLDASILDAATSLQSALQARLHAVHAHEPLSLNVYSMGNPDPKRFQQLNLQSFKHAAQRFSKALRSKKIGRSRQHLLQGAPAVVIPQVARAIDADIVVLGAIARSGIKRLIIGSTAEMVLNRLQCDMLVVKPRSFKTQVSRVSAGVRVIPTITPIISS